MGGCDHMNRFRKRGTYPDRIAVQVYRPNETRHLTAAVLRCMDCDETRHLTAAVLRCMDCDEMIGMEPSNDVGCEVEIRAAALARRYDLDNDWNGFESLGMVSPGAEHAPLIERDIAEGRKTERDWIDYYAGHLACVIATHDTAIAEHEEGM